MRCNIDTELPPRAHVTLFLTDITSIHDDATKLLAIEAQKKYHFTVHWLKKLAA
jgi:hypothetical protein